METNCIVTAPQVAKVEEIYEVWKRTHVGTMSKFYEFITTPSVDRDNFLNEWQADTEFIGAVAAVTLNVKE